MSLLRTLTPLVSLRPRPTPSLLCIRSIASATLSEQTSTPTTPLPTEKGDPSRLEALLIDRKLTSRDAEWWHRQDKKYGPDWETLLPPHARNIAQAQRQLLGGWIGAVKQEHGDQWIRAARNQVRLLENAYGLVFTRLRETAIRVQQITKALDTHASATEHIRNSARNPIRRLKWYNKLEQKYGTQWAQVAEKIVGTKQASCKIRKQVAQLRTASFKALSNTDKLAVGARRALAKMRWHHELEREHGDGWGLIAEEQDAQWTHKWEHSSVEAFPHIACWLALDLAQRRIGAAQSQLALLKIPHALQREHGPPEAPKHDLAALRPRLEVGQAPAGTTIAQADASPNADE